MEVKKHYYLMISCPGDVIKERELLKECVDKINHDRTDNSWVELRYWVNDTFSDASMSAQDSINQQIVNESDGLIAIFNARLGTPIHGFPCGTAEEISLMLDAHKHVSLLFNTSPRIDLNGADSIEQITKLYDYKKEQAEHAYYKEFNSDETFVTVVTQEVLLWLKSVTMPNDPIATMDRSEKNQTDKQSESDSGESTGHIVSFPSETSVQKATNEQLDIDAVDRVFHITDRTVELKKLLNQYDALSDDFFFKTSKFVEGITFASRRKNTGISMKRLCEWYELAIKELQTALENLVNSFDAQWRHFYSYVDFLSIPTLSRDDRLILKTMLSSLRGLIEDMQKKTLELFDLIEKTPCSRTEHTSAIKPVKVALVRFSDLFEDAISDCAKLEDSFV